MNRPTPTSAGREHREQSEESEEDRERYRELLEELRTIIPGVQVLFGFLLTAPFSSRFGDLDDTGRTLYAAVLTGVTLAIIVLLTPAALHRMSDGPDRATRVHVGVRCAAAGMTLLAVSTVVAVFMVARFVFGGVPATALATVVGTAFVGGWFVLPMALRGR